LALPANPVLFDKASGRKAFRRNLPGLQTETPKLAVRDIPPDSQAQTGRDILSREGASWKAAWAFCTSE